MTSADIPAYNLDGQVAGWYTWEDGTCYLVKRVNSHQHKLRQPPGWACDASMLTRLRELGGSEARVRLLLPDGIVLEATLGAYEQRGRPFSRGHGPQRVLGERWWQATDPKQARLL